MRFMLLIYDDANPPVILRAAERDAWIELLTVTGEWVDGRLLADASQANTVRVGDRGCEVRPGPFSRDGRGLIGYVEVECDSPERAIRIAGEGPWSPHRTVEIRPVMEEAGMEM